MHNSVIILASSSPDSEKTQTPQQPITIHSSPTYISTPCPPPREQLDPFLEDLHSPSPLSSFKPPSFELCDTSFFDDSFPELTLPGFSEISSSKPSTSNTNLFSTSTQPVIDNFQSLLQPESTVDKNSRKLGKRIRNEDERKLKDDGLHRNKLQKAIDLREKQNRIDLNKTRSKLECVQELLFFFHPALEKEFEGSENLFAKLKESEIQYKFDASVPEHCMVCERYTDRVFNSELHVWEPMENPVSVPESWIALFLSLETFRELVTQDPNTILIHLRGYKRPIIIVEGCTILNRTRKINETDQRWFELMHSWQIQMGITVLEPNSRSETVSLLHSLFFELGAMPYLRSVYQDGLYFSELNVKSGIGFTDSWRQFLMCILQMTEPAANAIIECYPTVDSLFKAYGSNTLNAPHLLENIMVQRGNTCKRLGPALSKRIHAIFMNEDPYYEPYV